MYKFEYRAGFHFFLQDEKGQKIPVGNWDMFKDNALSEYSILMELLDNGIAIEQEEYCFVDAMEVLKLNDEYKTILGLPEEYPYEIYIQSLGQLNLNTFLFKYGFYDFVPNGTIFDAKINGPILSFNGFEYLLSENQFRVCKLIEEFNKRSTEEKSFNENLKSLDQIKSLSKNSSVSFDGYLNSQEVYCPEKIKIDLEFKDNQIELIPTINFVEPDRFVKVYDTYQNARDSYPVSSSNGKVVRVVLSSEQKEELQRLKSIRVVDSQEKFSEIVDSPEQFFDDNETDISVFYSDRVREIGLYRPKYYPFVSPYKSEWIPGIVVRDKLDGEKRIYFDSKEKLSAFIENRDDAVNRGEASIYWEGVIIPVYEADRVIKYASRQFRNQSEPLCGISEGGDSEVLIIKENADFQEFNQYNPVANELTHSFSKISNLKNEIKLKDYQIEGVSWLQSLFKNGFSGCLLADDMGLGKTLQLLYFIEWHALVQPSSNKPYLIVAPVGLIENWESEYSKFFSPQKLKLVKLFGSTNLTRQFDYDKNKNEAKSLEFRQIILTSYETLRIYQATFGLIQFAIVALDEAQKIKTPGTYVTNASKALKADFKVAMTGTPVENTLVDIWCIIDFAVPGLLGSGKEFAKEYQKPLNDGKADVKALTDQLRSKIGIFIKRRIKSDVANELPKKFDGEESRLKKEMSEIQFERYKAEIENVNKCDPTYEVRNKKLAALWAIRDISDHPYLPDRQLLSFSPEDLIKSSAKLQITLELLLTIKNKAEKAIVFADRKEIQKMLQRVIYHVYGLFPSIINGDTPSTRQNPNSQYLSRQQVVDKFQVSAGFNVIIASPLAAGVGLNITAANHVIHYSRHWNPAKEEQATDRAYRIGQTRAVHVYYPMAVFPNHFEIEHGKVNKSFDEILDNLLKHKKSLSNNALFPTEQAEVRPEELFGDVFNFEVEANDLPLNLRDLDNLSPNIFEATIAVIYTKMGYNVQLTPYSNDKGVDIVAFGKDDNLLIQVKQSKTQVGRSAIQEVYTSRIYYESKYQVGFKLVTITNNEFSNTSISLTQGVEVRLISRFELSGLLNIHGVTLKEAHSLESSRMLKI